jgi:hypothetical protein
MALRGTREFNLLADVYNITPPLKRHKFDMGVTNIIKTHKEIDAILTLTPTCACASQR